MSHPFIQQNRFFLAAIATGLVVFALTLTARGAIAHTWTMATTRQPQGYYELYFTQPNKLPTQVFGGKTASVSFSIVDHDFSKYVDVLSTETVGSTAVILQTKRLNLRNGEAANETVFFTAPASGTNYQIQVRLEGTDQFIQFTGLSR